MERVVSVALGRIGRSARKEGDFRGRVLHLPDTDRIVIPVDLRDQGWWDCVEIGGATLGAGSGRVRVGGAELATARATIEVDPDAAPDRFVRVWLVRVWQCWAGEPTAMVARALVQHSRMPGTVTLTVDHDASRRVMGACTLSA